MFLECFSLDLQTGSDSLPMTDAGSEFQTDGAVYRMNLNTKSKPDPNPNTNSLFRCLFLLLVILLYPSRQ